MSYDVHIWGNAEVDGNIVGHGNASVDGSLSVAGSPVPTAAQVTALQNADTALDARLDVIEAFGKLVACGSQALTTNGVATVSHANILATDLIFLQVFTLSGVTIASSIRPTARNNGSFDVGAFLVATGLAATLDRSTFFWWVARP